MSLKSPRPWYCHGRLTDDYVAELENGGDKSMLKSLKVVRSIIVNVGLIAIILFAIQQGGDPTFFGLLGVLVLGAYNGIEIMDYVSLAQAIVEASQDTSDDQNQT